MGNIPANSSTNKDVPWYVKALDFIPFLPFPGISVGTAVKAAGNVAAKNYETKERAAAQERERVAAVVRTEILNAQVVPSSAEQNTGSNYLVPIAVALAIALLLGSKKRG
jgi:hypothetical protein